ncbi:carbohydrate kinase family protein [Candidatus Saccharibacteria bacterium]|nr:carbohydrate kinase family protein [Candidatus Saccharibacteria bacterium]
MANVVKVTTVGSALQSVYLLDDGDSNISAVNYSVDGGGANAAVTLARQGFDTSFMGVLGNDLAAQAVIDLFDTEGIDISSVKQTNRLGTGYKVLIANVDYTKYVYSGISTDFRLLDVDDLARLQPDWIYMADLSQSVDKLRQIVDMCVKLKIKIMLNPGKSTISMAAKIKPLLEDVDVLLVDKTEARALFSGSSLEELIHHAASLVKVAIITDAVNGSIATDGKTLVRAGIYEDVPIVDRSGAGDSFGAGFLSQWAKGKSLKDSIWFASANATAVVSSLGSQQGILPPKSQLHHMPIDEVAL